MTIKITILRLHDFDRWPNYFLHPQKCMVVFTILPKFYTKFSLKKTQSIWKNIFFLCYIWVFFGTVQICPQKKPDLTKKKKIVLPAQRFFRPYGIKRGHHSIIIFKGGRTSKITTSWKKLSIISIFYACEFTVICKKN